MQITTLHCGIFTYTPVEPCKFAVGLSPEAIGTPVDLGECLYALVTVQRGDTLVGANVAAKGLRRIGRHTTSHIVVNGFAHLRPDLADPETSMEILAHLAGCVQKAGGFDVAVMPFGWRKRWDRLEVLAGEWDQKSIYVAPRSGAGD